MTYKNPYGIIRRNDGNDTTEMISIEDCDKIMGNTICPKCTDSVLCKEQDPKNKYFKHKEGGSGCDEIPKQIKADGESLKDKEGKVGCDEISKQRKSGESLKHKEMKRKLIEEKEIPLRHCKDCGSVESKRLEGCGMWVEELYQKIEGERFFIDVVAVNFHDLILTCSEKKYFGMFFIEVVNTHRCSAKKYKAFEKSEVDWMEINCKGKYLQGNYLCGQCEKLKFGEYKGKNINEVLRIDKGFCLSLYLNDENLCSNIVKIFEEVFSNKDIRILCLTYKKITKEKRHGDEKLLEEREKLLKSFLPVFEKAKKSITGVSKWHILPPGNGKYTGKNVYDIDKKYLPFFLCNQYNNNPILKFFIVDALLTKHSPITLKEKFPL